MKRVLVWGVALGLIVGVVLFTNVIRNNKEYWADETKTETNVDEADTVEETEVADETNVADETVAADMTSAMDVTVAATATQEATESENEKVQVSYIDPQGTTLETRILVPEGYERLEAEEGSLLAFMRAYPMKEDQSPVLLYDGREKGNQSAHAAIMALPIENADLQQCADSVMRMYAEYFLAIGEAEKIRFHFTNGFEAEYAKWRDGYRIKVDGNQVYWVASAGYDDSYETFAKYMRMVFTYAGTLSMDAEANPITTEEAQPGDVFLKGGSPGHVVMIVDVCENKSGERAFLLAQGYMPAQEFHILKNPASDTDPWYYEAEITYPFSTPEYSFPEGSLQRPAY